MQKIITTNLRIPNDDLRDYRVVAAELGVSFNDLVLDALKLTASPISREKRAKAVHTQIEYSLAQLPDLPQLVREAEVSGRYQVSYSSRRRQDGDTTDLSQVDTEIYE
jgi:hypothetical protein